MRGRLSWLLALLALAALLAMGCSAEPSLGAGVPPPLAGGEQARGVSAPAGLGTVRTPPPLLLAEYVGSQVISGSIALADGTATAEIDLSSLARGYVAVKATSPTNLRIYVIKGSDQTGSPDAYFYYLDNDGTPNFYSISLGDGDYYFIVMAELRDAATGALSGMRVAEGWGSVRLESEFAPFIINNREVNYDADSAAVAFSYELAAHATTNLEVAQQVYGWIQQNVTYDTEKSLAVTAAGAGVYLPDPDQTLAEKTGICYDYAALAATMLRANGIPCQLVKGDTLDPDGKWIYHAWNMIWLEDRGWVAVSVPTRPGEWFRIDLTFAAGGGNAAQHINDDANYTVTEIS